jgi:DNA-binding response OmpR family regulator
MMNEMNRISSVLIIDSDPVHVAELVEALHVVNCGILVCGELEAALKTIRMENVDIVVLVSHSLAHWRRDAESLCQAVRQLGDAPQVICVLRGPYNGPSERLYGDRLNVKVLYEKQR